MTHFDDLLDIMRGGPDLSTGACKSRAPMFDDEIDGELAITRRERQQQAVEVCLSCPMLTSCQEWASSLYEFDLLGFVVAGEVRTTPSGVTTLTPRSRKRLERLAQQAS